MRYSIFLFSVLLFSISLNAQVGVNTPSPSDGAMLDVEADNKGILIPRVDIEDLSTIAPITGGATISLLVYNTNTTTGTGYHYWDGARWVAMGSEDWKIDGNTGVKALNLGGLSYLGTADNEHLAIATNGTRRMTVLNNGRIRINTTASSNDARFIVQGESGEQAVAGYAEGTAGVGVFGQTNGAGNAILGFTSQNGNAVRGISNGNGSAVFGTINSTTGIAVRAQNSSGTGITAVGGGTTGTLYGSPTGIIATGTLGVLGRSVSNTGTGIIAIGNSTANTTLYTGGSGIAANGLKHGVYGYAGNGDGVATNYGNSAGVFALDSDNNANTDTNRAVAKIAGFDNVVPLGGGTAVPSYYGGYFSGGLQDGTQTYAYVGMRYDTSVDGTIGTDYKIIGTGTVSTLINDASGTPRVMFAPEAPEIVFQDFGVGSLINGQAHIVIDPVLKKSLHVDEQHPLKVYVTLEGDCNGVYVTNKSIDGFTVKELQNGSSNVNFSWQIVANRADTKDATGNIISKHVGLRLPEGPSPLTLSIESQEVKDATVSESVIGATANKN